MKTLNFAGEGSGLPLEIGRHVTVRPTSGGWALLAPGDTLKIVDAETGQRGFALLGEVTETLNWAKLEALGSISGERPGFDTGPKLCAGLIRFYGAGAPHMEFCGIEFITYMHEVPFDV